MDQSTSTDVPTEEWHGCYDASWFGLIVPEAFQHPAKMSLGLLRRIFDYLQREGRLRRGDLVVDPFAGVGTTGIEAASRSLRFVGMELEEKWVKLANGYECDGKPNHSFDGETMRAACGGESAHSPHRVRGNYDLHRHVWDGYGDPLPVVLQGDSRMLTEVLGSMGGEAGVVVTSPPWKDNGAMLGGVSPSNGMRQEISAGSIQRNNAYGTTPGQLASLPPGSVDACVTSPPYEAVRIAGNSITGGNQVNLDRMRESMERKARGEKGIDLSDASNLHYGTTPGQLSNTQGETFWSAFHRILAQCHVLLKPRGTLVLVTKDFVRNKERVPFSADTMKLAQSLGFVPVLWAMAALVKRRRHSGLFEHEVVSTTERKSFFRRLAEQKGSPRIDHEDVLILEKQ